MATVVIAGDSVGTAQTCELVERNEMVREFQKHTDDFPFPRIDAFAVAVCRIGHPSSTVVDASKHANAVPRF